MLCALGSLTDKMDSPSQSETRCPDWSEIKQEWPRSYINSWRMAMTFQTNDTQMMALIDEKPWMEANAQQWSWFSWYASKDFSVHRKHLVQHQLCFREGSLHTPPRTVRIFAESFSHILKV